MAISVAPIVIADAYEALLTGAPDRHDRLVLSALERLVSSDLELVVLAQVSMARVLAQARECFPIPVLSSVDTSLPAVRQSLESSSLEPSSGRP